MDLSLKGKRALVCGASKGIGRAIAHELAQLGAQLVIAARSQQALEALAPQLLDAGAESCEVLVIDLDDREALAQKIATLLKADAPIHILINNSGGPAPGPLTEATAEQLLSAFGRHVLGSHAFVKALLPGMKEAGYGRIVNIISTSVREPIPNLGVSNTIRGAMASWSKTLSRELPPGITINNVLPGFTATERLSQLRDSLAEKRGHSQDQVVATWLAQVPEGRLAEPSEVAGAVAFLVSPAGAYIRGTSLAVDGGRLRSI